MDLFNIFVDIFHCIPSDFSDLPDLTGEYMNVSVVLEHS